MQMIELVLVMQDISVSCYFGRWFNLKASLNFSSWILILTDGKVLKVMNCDIQTCFGTEL